MADSSASSGFSLSGVEGGFASKTSDIFASFDAIEAKHNAVQKTLGEDEDLFKEDPDKGLFKEDPDKEKAEWGRPKVDGEGFKRPNQPPPRSRSPLQQDPGRGEVQQRQYRQYVRQRGRRERGRALEHNQNPDKWTKYDLTDVPEVTDRSNARAAMNFLDDIRNRDKATPIEELEGAEAGKHLFKPPTVRPDPLSSTGGVIVPSYGPSKRVMPEYVVGLGQRKAHSRAVEVSPEGGAVGLNQPDEEDTTNSPDPASLFSAYKDTTIGFDTPAEDLRDDLQGPDSPLAGPDSPLAGPDSPLTGPGSPLAYSSGQGTKGTWTELTPALHQTPAPHDTSEKPVFKSRRIRTRNTRRKSEEEGGEEEEGEREGDRRPQTVPDTKPPDSDSDEDWEDELQALREGGHSDDELNQVD